MNVNIKEKTNGRFYVEITTKTQQVFKTMSFKARGSATQYACEILDALTDLKK